MLGRGGGRRRQRSSEDEEGKEGEKDDELHRRLRHLSPPGPTPSGTFPHGPIQPGPLQPRPFQPRLFPNSPPSPQAAAATQRTWCRTRDRGLSRLAWHSNTQRRQSEKQRLQQLL